MDYVGIDLHKKESQICVELEGGELVEKRIPTTRREFEKFFKKLSPSRVLLEASTESEWVALVLESLGHEVIVADPNFAPMYATRQKKVKTDRRDARALCEACRLGAYRQAHRKSAEQRRRHNQLLVRDKLVGMRSKCIVTVRSLLRQQGLRVRSGAAETFAERVSEIPLDESLRILLAPVLEIFERLDERLLAIDKVLSEQAKADAQLVRLCTVPGVGPITSTAFVSVIDDVKRFEHAHKVASYVGLVPGERSSGDTKRRTSITKAGSRMLRCLLVQSALTIMRSTSRSTPLREWAQRIAARRGHKIARVALARRLAGLLFALMRDATTYESSHLLRPTRSPEASAA